MTEKRIIKPAHYPWDPNYDDKPYSLAVERHGLLCISGLTAETWSSKRGSYIVESTSLVKQTEIIFEKMGAILDAAGYTFADVVHTVDYALEPVMPEYRASGAVRRNAFGDSMPAAVGILVNGIPNSVSLMAVTAVAMRGGRHKRAIFPEGTPTWETLPLPHLLARLLRRRRLVLALRFHWTTLRPRHWPRRLPRRH